MCLRRLKENGRHTGIQVFGLGVQVEVLLKEESTYRRRSARLIRAVRLFVQNFIDIFWIRLRTS